MSGLQAVHYFAFGRQQKGTNRKENTYSGIWQYQNVETDLIF